MNIWAGENPSSAQQLHADERREKAGKTKHLSLLFTCISGIIAEPLLFSPFLVAGLGFAPLRYSLTGRGAADPRSFAGRGLRARYFASLCGARSWGFLPPLIIMLEPRVWHRFSHNFSEAKLRIIYIIAFRGPEPGVFFLPKISFGGPTTDTHQPLSFCVHSLVQFLFFGGGGRHRS